MERLDFIHERELPFHVFAFHRLRRAAHGMCASLMDEDALLDRVLRREATSAVPRFRIPVAYALSGLGRCLDLSLSAGAVPCVLRPIVRFNDWVDRIDSWFLGFGDWTGICVPAWEDSIVREARALLNADFRFTETENYRLYRRRMETGRPVVRRGQRLDTVARMNVYFTDFVALFHSIRTYGVLSHDATGPGPPAFRPQRDIGVAVDADGTLCKLPGGQHRFGIARALGIPFPAQLRMVHRARLAALMEKTGSSPVGAVLGEIERLNAATPPSSPVP